MSNDANLVVRSMHRTDPEIVTRLGTAGVATAHEAAGQIGLLDPGISPIQQGSTVSGPAVTVLCPPGDNMMIHAAVEVVRQGDILIVGTKEPSIHGMFGDLLATSLQAKGCVGLVLDASVRDVQELRKMGFPVWSRAIHAQGTVKMSAGSVNLPISIGGVTVQPGDVVVADDDGVMIVPRDEAASVAEVAEQRLAKEVDTRARLANGELGVDFYGFRSRLEGLGVRWVDRPEDV